MKRTKKELRANMRTGKVTLGSLARAGLCGEGYKTEIKRMEGISHMTSGENIPFMWGILCRDPEEGICLAIQTTGG